jgi:hypothetical protein
VENFWYRLWNKSRTKCYACGRYLAGAADASIGLTARRNVCLKEAMIHIVQIIRMAGKWTATRVTMAEFIKNYGTLADKAQTEPVPLPRTAAIVWLWCRPRFRRSMLTWFLNRPTGSRDLAGAFTGRERSQGTQQFCVARMTEWPHRTLHSGGAITFRENG